MRNAVVLLFPAVAALQACTGFHVDIAAETAVLRARSEAWFSAEKAGDADSTLAFFAPDAIIPFAGAPQVQGHEAFRSMYANLYQNLS